MVTEREAQSNAIKERLNRKFAQSGLSMNKLKNELNEKSGFEINYETLRNTLDYNNKSLDMFCVIAMCRYFNLDTAYILSAPDNPASAIYNEERQFVSERFSILDDPKYLGKYYGYFYSPKKTNQMIDSFSLELKKENGKTVARLSVDYHSIKNNGQMKITNKVMEGTPILVKPSSIYIVLTEGSGQFNILSFSYVHYNLNNLYFRRGAMLTHGRDATRQPLMQSFVMFDKKLSKDDMEYVPGFLLLYDTVFHIPTSEMQELGQKHPEIAYLFEEFFYIFKANTQQYYKVNEAQILASVRNNIPKEDVVKALQLMKAHATDAKRIYFPEIDDFSEFSKFLHQQ